MQDQTEKQATKISDDIKELVITRLDILSNDKKISIGSSSESFSKNELIEHVRLDDEIGRKVVDLELTYLRALKDGKLLDEILRVSE